MRGKKIAIIAVLPLLIAGGLSFSKLVVKASPAQKVAKAESTQATPTPTPTPTPSPKPIMKTLPTPGVLKTYVVTSVDDGDSISVATEQGTQPIRLVGYDAPELAYGNLPSQCFAIEAARKVKTDLLGKPVVLERDPTQGDTDDRGRLLRYVYLDGADYNRSLIGGGYGHNFNYHSQPHYLAKLYEQSQKEAENAGLGFWAKNTCDGNTLKPGMFLQSQLFQSVTPQRFPVSCASFKYHDDAQRFYEAHGGPFQDQYGLDPRRNGQACETLLVDLADVDTDVEEETRPGHDEQHH